MRFGLHRTLLLALVMLAGILNYTDRQIIAVLKPMLEEQLGWSDADYGFLVAAFQFAAAVAFIFAGWLIDRLGWRVGNPVAVGSWSMAAIVHGMATTMREFTAVRVALGATEALGTPAAIKTVAVWFQARERSLALGFVNAAGNIGAIIAPLVVPVIALAYGWRAAFYIMGGLGLVWVLAWWALTRSPYFQNPPPTQATAVEGARVPWRTVLSDRRTWAFAGAKVFSDQVWWFLLFWMPDLFIRVFGLDMRGFGVPLATIYAIAAIGSLAGGYFSGHLLARGVGLNRARKLTLLVCALLVLPVPLVLMVENYWLAVALLGLTLAAHQGFSVNLFATATDIIPQRRIATVISIGALCGNLAGMFILQLAGWVLAAGGTYAPMFALVSVSYLLALGWLHLLQPVLRPAD
ncbi:MFS transporter [Niveispirillum fermenti]|uniref:MFS transporter n=1 Tax=Niveispirillum fermenti TaxID=1233113 RepID=UPI003A83737A